MLGLPTDTQRHLTLARASVLSGELFSLLLAQPPGRAALLPVDWFIPRHRFLSRAVPSPGRTQARGAVTSELPLLGSASNSGIGAGVHHVHHHTQGLQCDSNTELGKGSGTRRSQGNPKQAEERLE